MPGELKKGCARRMEAARYTEKLHEDQVGRMLYVEVMEVVRRGRVTHRAARIAIELCLQELDYLAADEEIDERSHTAAKCGG